MKGQKNQPKMLHVLVRIDGHRPQQSEVLLLSSNPEDILYTAYSVIKEFGESQLLMRSFSGDTFEEAMANFHFGNRGPSEIARIARSYQKNSLADLIDADIENGEAFKAELLRDSDAAPYKEWMQHGESDLHICLVELCGQTGKMDPKVTKETMATYLCNNQIYPRSSAVKAILKRCKH